MIWACLAERVEIWNGVNQEDLDALFVPGVPSTIGPSGEYTFTDDYRSVSVPLGAYTTRGGQTYTPAEFAERFIIL